MLVLLHAGAGVAVTITLIEYQVATDSNRLPLQCFSVGSETNIPGGTDHLERQHFNWVHLKAFPCRRIKCVNMGLQPRHNLGVHCRDVIVLQRIVDNAKQFRRRVYPRQRRAIETNQFPVTVYDAGTRQRHSKHEGRAAVCGISQHHIPATNAIQLAIFIPCYFRCVQRGNRETGGFKYRGQNIFYRYHLFNFVFTVQNSRPPGRCWNTYPTLQRKRLAAAQGVVVSSGRMRNSTRGKL